MRSVIPRRIPAPGDSEAGRSIVTTPAAVVAASRATTASGAFPEPGLSSVGPNRTGGPFAGADAACCVAVWRPQRREKPNRRVVVSCERERKLASLCVPGRVEQRPQHRSTVHRRESLLTHSTRIGLGANKAPSGNS
jgi:hypothetical protein